MRRVISEEEERLFDWRVFPCSTGSHRFCLFAGRTTSPSSPYKQGDATGGGVGDEFFSAGSKFCRAPQEVLGVLADVGRKSLTGSSCAGVGQVRHHLTRAYITPENREGPLGL